MPSTTIRRSFLLRQGQASELLKRIADAESSAGAGGGQTEFIDHLIHEKHNVWNEQFYDTQSHQLSNAECILMKDDQSPKYWKFFCYAHDNIMEITTDEQEIKDPLSRLLDKEPDDINSDLLKPFFTIVNTRHRFTHARLVVELIETDYGYTYCEVACPNVAVDETHRAIDEIEELSQSLGFSNLAEYDPMVYL